MKRKRRWFLYPLIVLTLLLSAIPVYADTPTELPTMPHAFYGTATIGGLTAPVGTVVTAKVGGVECGSITTTVEGQYGGSGAFDSKLAVTGDIANGATISFYVGGSLAVETYTFSAGAVTELNLTVTDITAPSVTIVALTPDPTTDDTPTFTGTATDSLSSISSVEYKVDTGSWTAATASDGAFDGVSEGYTFTTATLDDGAHTVYVRATDAATNTTAEADYASDAFTVDATAPTVSSKSPAADATDVAVATSVSVTFSETMDESTVTASSFTLVVAARRSVSGTVSYNSGTNTATFTPGANLAGNTTYTATLGAAITDTVGNPLAEYSWDFTTETGVTPGDANEDGSVNALDITKVERIIAGLDTETGGADANEDGSVNALDITKVERIIAGLD